uniref:Ionotropic receptor Ir75h2 n=1 Tax=Anopheles quadriannulatus TaxID=34691 RepID=A0A8F5SM18_ANOQN|nr:ionotropic receptor Ir75h2 [Anopheles quadriannulatus]
MKVVVCALFLLGLLTPTRCSSRTQLIEEFLEQRSITSLLLLHCVQEPVDQDVIRIASALRQSFHGSVYYLDVTGTHFRRHFQWHMFYERYKTAITLNLECSGMESVLSHLSDNAYFNGTFHWLMFGGRNFEQVTCLLSAQNINYDASIMLVFDRGDRAAVPRIFEVYDVRGTVKRRGGRVSFELLGTVSSLNQLPKRRARSQDLEGIELWTALATIDKLQSQPFIEYLNTVKRQTTYTATIHSYQLVKLLEMKLNFKLIVLLTEDWRLDLIGKNSSRGVVGQIQTKQVDFATTPFSVTPERFAIFEYTIEIAHGTFYTVFRHPKSLNNSNIFMLPFTTIVWLAISLIFGAVALLIALLIVCIHRTGRSRSTLDWLVEQSLLGTLGMVCQQGIHHRIITWSSNRVLVLVAMCSSMILFQYYSSFIVGYQLITPPKTINTLEKLVDSEIQMTVENLSYQRDFFLVTLRGAGRTNNPTALKLYETKLLPNRYGGFVNLSFGMQLVRQGGYAFHCETSYGNALIIETFTEREICELQQLQLYPQRPVHLPLVKGSPLRELFKVNLQLLKERGLLAYHHARYYTPRPKCNRQSSTHTEQIHLADVRFAFVLLAAGMAASAALLASELVFLRLRTWWHERQIRAIPAGFRWLN